MNIVYNGKRIKQSKCFKYLGFHLDAKLSFRTMIDAQLRKLHKSYQIMKYIHNQLPSLCNLKMKFFDTYVWPHLCMMSTVYCLLSTSTRNRLTSFYRRCLRIIYILFQCPTHDLHVHFNIPTLEDRYRRSLIKRLRNIQQHEHTLLDQYCQEKHLMMSLRHHYEIKKTPYLMPLGRPNKHFTSLLYSEPNTFLDHLCQFVLN